MYVPIPSVIYGYVTYIGTCFVLEIISTQAMNYAFNFVETADFIHPISDNTENNSCDAINK